MRRIVRQREANGTITRNATGQITVLGGQIAETLYSYDALGNRSYTRDARGNITRSQYDSKARLVKTIAADGSNGWRSGAGNHYHLVPVVPHKTVEALIEHLIAHQPL